MNALIICQNCNIKFEEGKQICPICGYNQTDKSFSQIDIIEEKIIKRGWKNILISFSLLMISIPSGLVFAVDVTQNRSITWSLLIILPLFTSWLYLVLLLKLHRYPLLLGMLLSLLTVVFLYTLNIIQETTWFIPFGLPLSVGIPFISYFFIVIINKFKYEFLKACAIFFLAALVVSVYIEIVFSISAYQTIRLTWSLIVVGTVFPVSCMLFYLNKHKTILARWFHF